MIFCKELDKEFETKEEMFVALKANMTRIIGAKKSKIYEARTKGLTVSHKPISNKQFTDEAIKAPFEMDDDYYYIVVNSCYILDSHDDLHITGIWDDSLIDQQGKNYLVADHYLSIDNTIVKKAYIEMFVAKVPFSALGKPYAGSTQCLIYKFRKDKVIHDKAKAWLESGDEIEASVRMRYDDIEFALDSNHPDDVELKKRYDTYKPKIANASDFEYIYYFFIIKKAKNVYESSLVIYGSNPVTGQIENMKSQDKDGNENIDTLQSSQKLKSSLLLM